MEGLPIASYSLEDLLPDSILSTPAVSIRTSDPVTGVASLLPHHLETFTDSLVVTEDDKPVGIIGGIEILDGVLKNPTPEFFEKTTVGQIMNTDKLLVTTAKTQLSQLLKKWGQTRRAFAIIQNKYHGYSAISARKLLEIGTSCKTDMTISSVPKKVIITFKREDSMKQIIGSMFENNTRKLILEGTPLFISDRIIIQKIARELDCLHKGNNFLDMKADMFKLDEAKKISEKMKIDEASKIMYGMQSPYLIVNGQVITPWDIAMALSSDRLTDYNWQKR